MMLDHRQWRIQLRDKEDRSNREEHLLGLASMSH